jgi:hypothetical protein
MACTGSVRGVSNTAWSLVGVKLPAIVAYGRNGMKGRGKLSRCCCCGRKVRAFERVRIDRHRSLAQELGPQCAHGSYLARGSCADHQGSKQKRLG